MNQRRLNARNWSIYPTPRTERDAFGSSSSRGDRANGIAIPVLLVFVLALWASGVIG